MGGSLGTVVESAVKAICTLLFEATYGVILARHGILPQSVQHGLSKLYILLLLPCLLFSSIPTQIDPSYVLSWWPLIVLPTLYVFIGMFLGYVACRVFKIKGDSMRFLVICVGFNNVISLPLALAQTLGGSVEFLTVEGDERQDTIDRGTAYVSFINLFNQILTWTIAYQLLRPQDDDTVITIKTSNINTMPVGDDEAELTHKDSYSKLEDSPDLIAMTKSLTSSSSYCSNEEPLFKFKSKEHEVGEVEDHFADLSSKHSVKSSRKPTLSKTTLGSKNRMMSASGSSITLPTKELTWKDKLRNIMQPPIYALIIAVFIGLIQPAQDLFFPTDGEQEAPLTFFTSSIVDMGGCAVPVTLLLLGAKMANGPSLSQSDTSGMPKFRTIVGTIVVLRLIVMGVVPIILVWGLNSFGLILDDPIFRIILMITACTPTMINLVPICVLHGAFEREMGTVLFFTYLFGIPGVTMWVAIYLDLEERVFA